MTEQYRPEIGEYCEVYFRQTWSKVLCLGYDGDNIIWKDIHKDIYSSLTINYRSVHINKVREYKNPYTKFSQGLELLFDNNDRVYCKLNSSDYQEVIKLLWENGYRKVEEYV